jgi:hypothetical protein
LVKPTSFGEDAAGYEKLFTLLGSSEEELLIAMEATRHYGWNLSATLRAKSFKVALPPVPISFETPSSRSLESNQGGWGAAPEVRAPLGAP